MVFAWSAVSLKSQRPFLNKKNEAMTTAPRLAIFIRPLEDRGHLRFSLT